MKTVWSKEHTAVKNITLAFVLDTQASGEGSLSLVASNLYRFFLNGELMGYGPARAAHGYTRRDIYRFSLPEKRKNRLVIEVFSAHVNSFYTVDEAPFFGAELEVNDRILAATEDFRAYLLNDRVVRSQRFSFQRTFVESYRMESCRQAFYRSEETKFPALSVVEVPANTILERGVSYPSLENIGSQMLKQGTVHFEDGTTMPPVRYITDISPRYKGYAYPELEECLADEIYGLRWGVERAASSLSSSTYALFDFGRTVSGFFQLAITVRQETEGYLLWDEVLSDSEDGKVVNPFRNDCTNVIKYRLKPGTYSLLSFEANTARYAAILCRLGEFSISSLHMVAYENPNVRKFGMETADPQLNAILDASRHTFAQNSVDILMDCPSRERAGWLCDSYFSARTERLLTGGNKVERNFLQNYILAPHLPELPEGMLPMCYPADHPDGTYIPNWSMWFVLELQSYWRRTGDRTMIDAARDKVYALLRYFQRYENENGLLEDLQSWVFIEWSQCNDPEFTRGVNYPSNMLYAAMLEAAGTLYADEALLQKCAALRHRVRYESFNGCFFEENRIRDPQGKLCATGHLTETCQYYAFYFHTADPCMYAELFETLVEKFGPGRDRKTVFPEVWPSNAIVGNYLRMELLLREGLNDRVLEECRRMFSAMAATTGTLWENSFLGASLNHGFASIAANYIGIAAGLLDMEALP